MSEGPGQPPIPQQPIRDRGYARYEGARAPGRGVVGVITSRMLRTLGRQPWVLAMLIISAFPTVIWAVALVIRGYVSSALPAGAEGAELGFASGREYLLNVAIKPYGSLLLSVLVSMFAGSAAIADDRRQGALALYFSRPVSVRQYLWGKTVPVALLVGVVSVLPLGLLAIIEVAIARSRPDLWSAIAVLPRAVLLGAVEAALFALPAVTLSSILRSRGAVQGAYALLVFLPWIVGRWLSSSLRSVWPTLMILPAQLESLGRWLLGVPVPDEARLAPPWAAALTIAAVLAGCAFVLDRQMRRLESGAES